MIKDLRHLGGYLAKLDWLQRLWLLAPIMIWFSYYPKISLGGDATMNYELSLTLIYVVVLAVVGVSTIWRHRRTIWRSKHIWILTAYVAWSAITIVWSVNRLRGVLTVGVLGLLYLIFLAAWAERAKLRQLIPIMANLMIGLAVVASVLALLQMVAGTYIQTRTSLGLCAGCVAGQFGFVRPNLFAIEPQFLGSLLIAPVLIVCHRLISGRRSWQNCLILVLLATVLGLTLSRGAIYACGLGVVVIWLVVRHHLADKLVMTGLIVVGAGLCLTIQGGLAAINPYIQESFGGAVTKSINHLSLGVIDLRGLVTTKNTGNSPASDDESSTNQQQPAYDGYVAESTDVRVSLTRTALAAWSEQDLFHRLFGVGLGSAGVVMAEQTGSTYAKEIVQNEYVEVLLERGLIGALLFVAAIISTFHKPRRRRQLWAWAILVAYLVQWCFFSGLPNALHIYLVASWLLII